MIFRIPVDFDIEADSLESAIGKLHHFFSDHPLDQHDYLPKDTVDYLIRDDDIETIK